MALLAQMALFSTRVLTKLIILAERFFFYSAKSVNSAKSFCIAILTILAISPTSPLSPMHFFFLGTIFGCF